MLQIAMPVLFQGHIDLLEEYLSRSREQQVAFVQFVDQIIDSESNIDAIIRCICVVLLFLVFAFVIEICRQT